MKEFLFPKTYFPSKASISAWIVLVISLLILVTTLGVMPVLHSELNKEYQQPREVNSLALVGFIGGMSLYAIERGKKK